MVKMKKLFVSVPMKGRTEEEIKASIQKMKKIAEIYEGEELELIDSYIDDNPPKDNNQAIWFLGKSLEKLATAGGTNTIKFKGDSGSATDGGAINTLTEEEIAVATAKGWTVSLV